LNDVREDPIALFRKWHASAGRAKVPLHDAFALATADRRGRPAARFVLLKGSDERGFVFYTNAESPKGRDLKGNPRASAVFYWDATGRQVRIDGRVEKVSKKEADAYWRTRPRMARLGAIVSRQSRPMKSRAAFIVKVAKLAIKYSGRPVPRPARWTGYRIVPSSIEFWTRRLHRLHERVLFRHTRSGWSRTILHP